MPEEVLERVLREIGERKQAARAAYEESRRLEEALAALGPSARGPSRDGSGAATRRRSRPRATPSENAGPTRAGRRTRPARSRAAPGVNRERIVTLVRERPGVTAREIADATGIARSTVTTTLKRLADVGQVVRAERPGGRAGFHAHDGEPAAGPRPPRADAEPARAAARPNAE